MQRLLLEHRARAAVHILRFFTEKRFSLLVASAAWRSWFIAQKYQYDQAAIGYNDFVIAFVSGAWFDLQCFKASAGKDCLKETTIKNLETEKKGYEKAIA